MEYFLLYTILKPMLDICQAVGMHIIQLISMILMLLALLLGGVTEKRKYYVEGIDEHSNKKGQSGYWVYED